MELETSLVSVLPPCSQHSPSPSLSLSVCAMFSLLIHVDVNCNDICSCKWIVSYRRLISYHRPERELRESNSRIPLIVVVDVVSIAGIHAYTPIHPHMHSVLVSTFLSGDMKFSGNRRTICTLHFHPCAIANRTADRDTIFRPK